MAQNEGTQKQSEWTSNKEMNIKENSSETDSVFGNEDTGESSWRPTDDQGEFKEPTSQPTGTAGESPASQGNDSESTPDKIGG